ncbi:nicotinate (nicotinamide) nucleotide adenylyltransferase [Anaerococcus sp. Marseille-P3625]|uniref:nicotinate (nicotinamide) nucleotide adenylyltransferase n=1 Tax=Anaerococcus sp. Marseille-P3625 TaxID=1977277 RepID=UPI000C08CF3D|nr:nicotinate (nicotinamide) nucleotide adenylyltransferase [Anaerococcus sp. Marseille-P3625]
MKIGLFGGTFDPIHLGHLIVMENVLNFMNLDKIIILPSSNPPHKLNKDKTDVKLRVDMVKKAIENNNRIILSTFEADNNEVIYSYQTINYFKEKYPSDEFYYIMGEDSFMNIESWKNYKDLLKENLIVFARSSIDSQSSLVKKVKETNKENIYLINNLNINISSTLIRNLVRDKKSIRYLVTDDVYDFIMENKLYV